METRLLVNICRIAFVACIWRAGWLVEYQPNNTVGFIGWLITGLVIPIMGWWISETVHALRVAWEEGWTQS